jgi:hypothetical protein
MKWKDVNINGRIILKQTLPGETEEDQKETQAQ